MAAPGRTQKQIAERYKGNLGYYKRKHPWRVARFCATLVAIVGGLAAILIYQNRIFRRQADEEFFSSGKLSSHHAKYEQDCTQCHDKNASMGSDLTLAKFKTVVTGRFQHGLDFKSIDLRCQQCHEKNPKFHLTRDRPRDPDVWRSNPQRHSENDIPPVTGKKLDCNYCHKPEPGGRFYQRISFAANCQPCHALLFDKNNPQLHLPHGDVNLVRTFLRTLPAQYANFARYPNQGAGRYSDVKAYVAQQMNQLRMQFGSDAEFERSVFFETDPYKPHRQTAAATRGNFAGCAFCHEVKTAAGGAPVVAKT